MNSILSTPTKIQSDSEETPRRLSHNKHHKKHKRRSSSRKHHTSKSREVDVPTTKNTSKTHSSSKEKKKRKHKKRHVNSPSKIAGDEAPREVLDHGAQRRPSTETDSSVSVKESTQSGVVADSDDIHSMSTDSASSSPKSQGSREQDTPPRATMATTRRSRNKSRPSMDSYKKDFIGALTPELVEVPRKPASLPMRTPRRSSTPQRKTPPQAAPTPLKPLASRSSTNQEMVREFCPTPLKPLAPRRRPTDQLSAIAMPMREFRPPDQFMTVTRKHGSASGRRVPADGTQSGTKQHDGTKPSMTLYEMTDSDSYLQLVIPPTLQASTNKATQQEAAVSASTSNNGIHHKYLGHFMTRAFHHKPRGSSRLNIFQ